MQGVTSDGQGSIKTATCPTPPADETQAFEFLSDFKGASWKKLMAQRAKEAKLNPTAGNPAPTVQPAATVKKSTESPLMSWAKEAVGMGGQHREM